MYREDGINRYKYNLLYLRVQNVPLAQLGPRRRLMCSQSMVTMAGTLLSSLCLANPLWWMAAWHVVGPRFETELPITTPRHPAPCSLKIMNYRRNYLQPQAPWTLLWEPNHLEHNTYTAWGSNPIPEKFSRHRPGRGYVLDASDSVESIELGWNQFYCTNFISGLGGCF